MTDRRIDPTTITEDFLNLHFPDDWARKELPNGIYTINSDKLEALTDLIQLQIADVVAAILDAGSEREVVLEDEDLREAILNTLRGWGDA